jgi:isoleucyl-tRNA synthetase
MNRIPEVMDAWFDSGAMPYAQWHYPFENENIVHEGKFPADYICEAVDQTRGWFYSLHALGTLLHDQPAYKNVICLGLILDGRGRKMSKRVGNVVEPSSVLDVTGADALRWYLFTASHPGEPRRFSDKLVSETLRRVLLTLWNVYSFFTNYATIDNFTPDDVPDDWKPENELDRWILSELNVLVTQVDDLLEQYNPTDAGRKIQEFIDGLSNWYVRRSRRRFWRSENDSDKISAYATLYGCLCTVSKLMAPLAPFISEEIYQNLVGTVSDGSVDSVHLCEFPKADDSLIDQELMDATRLAMRVSSMGRAARSRAGLKVRQPLSVMAVNTRNEDEEKYLDWVRTQVLEELNVKDLVSFTQISGLMDKVKSESGESLDAYVKIDEFSVVIESGYMVALDGELSDELIEEGLARELAHRIQNMRKDSNFDLTDRIRTYYQGPERIGAVMRNYSGYISQETLSDDLVDGLSNEDPDVSIHTIDGMEISLMVKRS